jgi:hypothetical protein
MTGFWIGIMISIITGALVNEFCDVSPWIARKVIRRAASLWAGADLDLASAYKAEWAAVVEDCPGKITKLIHATSFYSVGVAQAVRRQLKIRDIRRDGLDLNLVREGLVYAVGVFACFLGLVTVAAALAQNALSAPLAASFPLAGVACLLRPGRSARTRTIKRWFSRGVGSIAASMGGVVICTLVIYAVISGGPSDLFYSGAMLTVSTLWFAAGYISFHVKAARNLTTPRRQVDDVNRPQERLGVTGTAAVSGPTPGCRADSQLNVR